MQERHRQVQHAAADIGGDHQLLAIEAIDERPGDRTEHERGQGARNHHAGDGDAGGADAPDPRDDRRHGDEPEPVAERRHHHGREQPREAAVGEQILDRGRASAAELGDLVRDRRHRSGSLGLFRRGGLRRGRGFLRHRGLLGRGLLLGGGLLLCRRLLLGGGLLLRARLLGRLGGGAGGAGGGLGGARLRPRPRGRPPSSATMSRSNSAPQPQQRIDFGRCTSSDPSSGQRGSFSGSLFTAKSQSG